MSHIHNPSQFLPENYTVVDYIDANEPANISAGYKFSNNPNARAALLAELKEFYDLCEKYFGVRAAPHKCEHCGHYARYFGVALHIPTNKHVAIGHICTANRLGLTNDNFRWTQLKNRAQAVATGARRDKALSALEETNPELFDAIVDAFTDDANREDAFAREHLELGAQNDVEKQIVTEAISNGINILSSVANSIRKYDYKPSDAQRSLLISGLNKSREIATKRIGWAREKAIAQQALATLPVLEGRITFTGVIQSFKFIPDTGYGSNVKFILKDAEGRKVYTTVPSGLDVYTIYDKTGAERDEAIAIGRAQGSATIGDTVSIVVKVEQAPNDAGFYFGSRPSLTKDAKKKLKAQQDADDKSLAEARAEQAAELIAKQIANGERVLKAIAGSDEELLELYKSFSLSGARIPLEYVGLFGNAARLSLGRPFVLGQFVFDKEVADLGIKLSKESDARILALGWDRKAFELYFDQQQGLGNVDLQARRLW